MVAKELIEVMETQFTAEDPLVDINRVGRSMSGRPPDPKQVPIPQNSISCPSSSSHPDQIGARGVTEREQLRRPTEGSDVWMQESTEESDVSTPSSPLS